MLTIENIFIFIILSTLFLNFQTIVGGIMMYFFELRDVVIKSIKREEVDEGVEAIIKPYENFLIEKGFHFLNVVEYQSMVVKLDKINHVYYYYHETLGVHAFITTTPLQGSIRNATISFNTFYESYNMAITFDCFKHNMFDLETSYIFDYYFGSFEKAYESHLSDRVISSETIVKEPLSEEGLRDYEQYMINETISEMKKENILTVNENGMKFSFSLGYIKHVYQSMSGHKKAQKVLLSSNEAVIKEATLESDKMVKLFKNSEGITIAQSLEEKPKATTKESKIRTFIISGISFVLLFGLIGIPWSSLPILIVILLVHELGHYFAMRYFGYSDTSIFFIPLFGAVAKGTKEKTSAFEEYIVYLAGPLPGMIIALIMFYMTSTTVSFIDNPYYKEYMIMSFAINYINLLPIFPLDGGKIFQTLLFGRYPKAQFYFFLVSLFVIVSAALMLKSIILGFFAVALFISINQSYYTAILIEKAQHDPRDIELKEKVLDILTSEEQFKKVSLVRKSAMAKQALKVLIAEKPSKTLMFIGMGFYFILLLPPLLLAFFGMTLVY